jgi:hypothetical protein
MLVERIRLKVTLNKPIYIGFTVLDLSKMLFFDFHYNVMPRRYGTDATAFLRHRFVMLSRIHRRHLPRHARVLTVAGHVRLPSRSFPALRRGHEGNHVQARQR